MRPPLILLLLSAACAGASRALGGPILTLPLAVSALAGLAAVLLVIHAALHGRRTQPGPDCDKLRHAPMCVWGARRSPPKHVVIDGSNVMHWDGQVPRLKTLRAVIAELQGQGYQPGIVFDANAGYKLADRYLDDRDFAKLLNLPGDRVLVVAKGKPADPTILAAARDLGANIISNDRFRDWVGDFPEVTTPGCLCKGGFRNGQLWLQTAT